MLQEIIKSYHPFLWISLHSIYTKTNLIFLNNNILEVLLRANFNNEELKRRFHITNFSVRYCKRERTKKKKKKSGIIAAIEIQLMNYYQPHPKIAEERLTT
jgi:hypothetical protein